MPNVKEKDIVSLCNIYKDHILKVNHIPENIKVINYNTKYANSRFGIILDTLYYMAMEYGDDDLNYLMEPWYIITDNDFGEKDWKDAIKEYNKTNIGLLQLNITVLNFTNSINMAYNSKAEPNIIVDINEDFSITDYLDMMNYTDFSEMILLLDNQELKHYNSLRFYHNSLDFIHLFTNNAQIDNAWDIALLEIPFNSSYNSDKTLFKYFNTNTPKHIITTKYSEILQNRICTTINKVRLTNTAYNVLTTPRQYFRLTREQQNIVSYNFTKSNNKNIKIFSDKVDKIKSELATKKREYVQDNKTSIFHSIKNSFLFAYKCIELNGNLLRLKNNKDYYDKSDISSYINWKNNKYKGYLILEDIQNIDIKDIQSLDVLIILKLNAQTSRIIENALTLNPYLKIIIVYNPEYIVDFKLVKKIKLINKKYKHYGKEDFVRLFS